MTEVRTLTTLRYKRADICTSIEAYEKKLEQTRADLSHINAIIRIFEASGEPETMARYVDTLRLFKFAEKWTLCRQALVEHGEVSTKELCTCVMRAKGLDDRDNVLAKRIGSMIVQSTRQQRKGGKVQMIG